MENLDTEDKVRTYLATHLDSSHSLIYISLEYKHEYEHIHNTWIISASKPENLGKRGLPSYLLFVADDGSLIREYPYQIWQVSKEFHEEIRNSGSIDDIVADGSWKTLGYIDTIYSNIKIDNIDKLKTWLNTYLPKDYFEDFNRASCQIERIGDAWVIVPPPDEFGMSTLIIASDGSVAKEQFSARPLISFREKILSGDWKTAENLGSVYPKIKMPLPRKPRPVPDPNWKEKLVEVKRKIKEEGD